MRKTKGYATGAPAGAGPARGLCPPLAKVLGDSRPQRPRYNLMAYRALMPRLIGEASGPYFSPEFAQSFRPASLPVGAAVRKEVAEPAAPARDDASPLCFPLRLRHRARARQGSIASGGSNTGLWQEKRAHPPFLRSSRRRPGSRPPPVRQGQGALRPCRPQRPPSGSRPSLG